MREIYEQAPVLLLTVDAAGCVAEASEHFIAWSGYARGEIVGRPLAALAAAESRDRLTAEALAQLAGRGSAAGEIDCTFYTRTGAARGVQLSAALERARGSAPSRFWVVLRDVAEGRRDREEIRRRERLYHAVFDQTFQLVALLEPSGRLCEANDTLRGFAGLSDRDAIAGRFLWDLEGLSIGEETRARLQGVVAQAAGGSFARDEVTLSGIAETETILDLSIKPVRDETGRVELLILECRDVTEQRLQDQMLLQATKMEALGELTSGIAHDFNNLLAIVGGNLELVEARLDEDSPLRDRLRRATDAAFRGRRLTQQLLAFSRKQPLSPTAVAVPALVAGMAGMLDALGDDIEVEVDIAPNLEPCWADPAQLEAVLLNIAINARDAMPEGGRIALSAAMTDIAPGGPGLGGEIGDLSPGRYVCLMIADQGVGMAPDVAEHAFEPFFTTKPEGEGTGLGLSMAYGFARQSGGALGIESEIGVGTTVRLYLPRSEVPARTADKAEAPVPDLCGRNDRVLIVEDDEEVRDLAVTMFHELGFTADEAADGEAAVALLGAGRRYDLVFTDVVMRGAHDGVAVARAARAADPSQRIVFCSGFVRRPLEDIAEFRDPRIRLLIKPFRLETLADVVRAVLDA